MAISANCDIAVGGGNKITLCNLCDILPSSYVSAFASRFRSLISNHFVDGRSSHKESGKRGLMVSRQAPAVNHFSGLKMTLKLICAGQGRKYTSRSKWETPIENVVRGVIKRSPFVLIDVKSGHLCDARKRMRTFKAEPEFKELISSITERLDGDRVRKVAEKYFQYVTLSHVWEGEEPLFQDVNKAGSVWDLDESSPLNQKLRKFCEVVRADGYRWAWSDTCCIDKTVSTVLNQSLKMMYKWYEASAATFVCLVDVTSPSVLGALLESIWMTRAWTSQELLAPKVIRFYTSDWKP